MQNLFNKKPKLLDMQSSNEYNIRIIITGLGSGEMTKQPLFIPGYNEVCKLYNIHKINV